MCKTSFTYSSNKGQVHHTSNKQSLLCVHRLRCNSLSNKNAIIFSLFYFCKRMLYGFLLSSFILPLLHSFFDFCEGTSPPEEVLDVGDTAFWGAALGAPSSLGLRLTHTASIFEVGLEVSTIRGVVGYCF